MPRYTRGKGKLQKRKKFKFDGVNQMVQWLSKTSIANPLWEKHFKNTDKMKKEGAPFFHPRSVRAIQTQTPVRLAGDVLSELKKQQKGHPVGGGIAETLHWLASEAAQVTGFNTFKEFVGEGYEHRKVPREQQTFAKAVRATYKDLKTRPSTVEGLTRIPAYDSDRCSVWLQQNGQYLVTVHGTKASWGDVDQDLGIVVGKKAQNEDVQKLFDRLDQERTSYDIAGHSLGTQFIVNAKHHHADSIYLFNSASSPLMESEYLKQIANDPKVTQFINPSDPVSQALWNEMSPDTVSNSFIAPYMRSSVAAHSLEQWYGDLEKTV